MVNEIKESFKDQCEKTIKGLNSQLKKIRTGRASTSILESVLVDYYGTPTPIPQVATVSVPEARLIVIQPWEKSMIGAIEKAILKAELGFNPSNDGNVIRINIPALTEETRKGIVKEVKGIVEQFKVTVRNHRRDSNDILKSALKKHEITEDAERQGLDDVQKITDKYIKEIDKIYSEKEKEILEI